MNGAFSSPRLFQRLWDAAAALQPARSTLGLHPEATDHVRASSWGPFWQPGSAETSLLAPHFGTPRCARTGPRCAGPGQAGSRSLAGSAPQKKTDYILYIRLCGIKHWGIWKANYFSGRACRIFSPLKSLMTVFMGKFPWVPPRLKAFFYETDGDVLSKSNI